MEDDFVEERQIWRKWREYKIRFVRFRFRTSATGKGGRKSKVFGIAARMRKDGLESRVIARPPDWGKRLYPILSRTNWESV
jgi:hypothetical protein